MADSDDVDAGTRPLSASISSLLAALLGSVRTRAELASVEFAEERARIGQQLALLIAGLLCLMFAVLFVAVGVIAWYWDSYRMAAIVGVIVVFAGAGTACLWWRASVARVSPTPFAATLAELEKDRAALARAAARRPAP